MTKPKELWSAEDELAYLAGDMDGILYQDENRELATEKSILQVKGLTNNTTNQQWPDDKAIRPKTSESGLKIDSNDKPDIPTPAFPFWMNIKR